jgi:hypothetical protein
MCQTNTPDRYLSESLTVSKMHQMFLDTYQTHFVFNNFFFSENRALYFKKYFRSGQATDKNMAHAHCMLDT